MLYKHTSEKFTEIQVQLVSAMETNYYQLLNWRAILRRFLHASNVFLFDAGITSQQYQVMLILWGAARARKHITIKQIAVELDVRHNTTVVLVNRLEGCAYVTRCRDPLDQRCMLLTLTEIGESVLQSLVDKHRYEFNRVLVSLRDLLQDTLPII